MEPIRAAVFDLDGTLVDTLPASVEAFNAVVVPFLGTRLTANEVRGLMGSSGEKALRNFLPPGMLGAGAHQLRAAFLTLVSTIRAFPGTPELLAEIARRGCRIGVATTHDRESVTRILESTQLGASVERVLCGTEALGESSAGVDPAALGSLARELGGDPARVVYVCDSPEELEIGRKAGLRTAAVAWGYHRREELASQRPDFLFESPALPSP